MTCISCANATTRNVNGGLSPHRRAMWKLGMVGCRLDKDEATSYPKDREWNCPMWKAATVQQMEQRK